MRAQAVAEEDRSPAVAPAIVPAAPWRVRCVDVLPDFELKVEFNDGLSGTVRMKRLVQAQDAGEFRRLADPVLFAQAGIELGVVTWPGGLDLAPDAMHDSIAQRGEFVPQ